MPTFTATSDGSSQYAELEPGIYEARVFKAEAGQGRTSGNELIRLYLKVFGTHGTTEIRENLVFTTKSFWKIEQFWRATGHDFRKEAPLSIEARDCYGLSCWVKTDQRPGTRNPDMLFPYVEYFMREEEAPYKGIDPVYVPQSRQQPAAQQQRASYQSTPPQQQGGWSRQGNNLYPPSGASRPAAPQQAPTLEDDDIPF